ncbi:MAG: hypothetical protein R3D02_08950 [Hyphomicrobiales bacterium]
MNMHMIDTPDLAAEPVSAPTPDLTLQSIHPDWQGEWGATIRSKAVRRAVAANPRLSARLAAAILAARNIPDDDIVELPEDDRRVLAALAADPARFVERVGLVWMAEDLATRVTPAALEPWLRHFDPDQIRAAMRLRTLAPASAEVGLSSDRLADIVRRRGTGCLLIWSENLPEAHAGRVRLMLPRDPVSDLGYFENVRRLAHRIVLAVADDLATNRGS